MSPAAETGPQRMRSLRRAHLALLALLATALLVPPPAQAGSCVPSPTTLCLGGGRYQVEVDWQSAQASGEGQVFPVAAENGGFFTFDEPTRVELLARVFDGCSINGRSWVFLADLSTLGLTIDVTDTASGAMQSYNLPAGATSQPVIDTTALTCPTRGPRPFTPGTSAPTARGAGGGAHELPLIGGRFRVSVVWEDAGGNAAPATPIPLTNTTGAFWYADSESPERLLKIEPDTQANFYRLVTSAPSELAQTITVVDTCRNATRIFDLLAGVVLTIVEPQMQPVFCAGEILYDGFESGDLGGWSDTTP